MGPRIPVLTHVASRELADRRGLDVTRLVRDRVRYLGPLRQEPQPHSDFGDENRSDVGAAGEHIARVPSWAQQPVGLGAGPRAGGASGRLEALASGARNSRRYRRGGPGGRAGVSIEVRPAGLDRQVDPCIRRRRCQPSPARAHRLPVSRTGGTSCCSNSLNCTCIRRFRCG